MSPGPYPSYKPSGIPWLADVPVHWEMRRGGWLFRKMDRAVRDTDEVITCFRDGTVTLRKNRRKEGFTESLKEIGYQGIRNGDLVVHQMDAFAGAVGVSDSAGKGTPVYSVCHPSQDADPFYYAHIVREMARSQWILALAKGIRERSTDFRYSEFALQALPLPPIPEQAAIVRYLNHADRRIRRYISAKRKLIALLEEEKQAVVNRTVTRGLDPDVRLKPSGVEWLGDVPEHWELVPNRLLLQFKRDVVGDKADNYTLLSLTKRGVIARDMENAVGKFPSSFETYQAVVPGDLIFCLFDIDETPRTVGLSRLSGMLTGAYTRFVCADETTREFLFLLYLSMDNGKLLKPLYSGLRKVIPKSAFLSAKVALPPLPEQTAIVEYIDKTTADIDTVIARTRRQIELLQEYRSRLIADVVTGKLDVREAAALLPDDPEDEESIDEDSPLAEDTNGDSHDPDVAAEELAMESEVTI